MLTLGKIKNLVDSVFKAKFDVSVQEFEGLNTKGISYDPY